MPSSSQTRTPTRSQARTTTTASTRTGTATAAGGGRSRGTRNALSLGDEEDDEMGDPFNTNNNNNNRRNGNRGGAGTRDAMSEDDGIPGSQAEEDGMNNAARGGAKGRRARMNLDVPPVRDATGEKVMESFEVFLKTWVFLYSFF
jgi:hypothetical protein